MSERTYLAIFDKDGDERRYYPLTDLDRAVEDLATYREMLSHDAPYCLCRVTVTTKRVTLEGV